MILIPVLPVPSQKSITFKWEDFLDLANFLSLDGNEAKRRTAISRAYCSAFMIVKRVLEGKDQDYIYKIQALEKIPQDSVRMMSYGKRS